MKKQNLIACASVILLYFASIKQHPFLFGICLLAVAINFILTCSIAVHADPVLLQHINLCYGPACWCCSASHRSKRSSSPSSGSPPMPGASSSSLTNEVPKPPVREAPPNRPPYTPTLGGQAPHSQQFPRTRKMFDRGPDQVQQ